MRKYNVFGQKLSKTKALPFMILIFIAVLTGYYFITLTQTKELEKLEAQEIELRAQIDQILLDEESRVYLEIGELMPFIPTSYQQTSIENDVIIAKNSTLLNDVEGFNLVLTDDVNYPLEEIMSASLKTVRLNISFTTDDVSKSLDFMNDLIESNYIYYIESMQVSFLTNGDVQVEFVAYTFYYEISE